MKYGINTLLYTAHFSNENLGLIPKAKKLGFDGVEIALFDLAAIDAKAIRTVLDDNEMQVTTCNVFFGNESFIDESPAIRQAARDKARASIDKARELGSPILCGPLYAPVGKLVGRGRTPDEWKRAVEELRVAGEYARKAGLVLGIEPINRFETYFLNTIADAAQLCREVGLECVRVHVDTFHAHIEEKNTAKAIVAAGDLVCHVHCSENDRGIAGTGQVRWRDIFKALRKIGYDDWLVIESFVPAIEEIAAAASIWRELAPSADALAEESVKFLKSMRKETK